MDSRRLKYLAGMMDKDEWLTPLKEGEDTRLTREAFVYMKPKAPEDKFAECGTCIQFGTENERCAIFGSDTVVKANWSCALYVHGEPQKKVIPIKRVSPKEAGLVKASVRCENCVSSSGDGKCGLFQKLNEKLPKIFNLDENIEAKACCNAWAPK